MDKVKGSWHRHNVLAYAPQNAAIVDSGEVLELPRRCISPESWSLTTKPSQISLPNHQELVPEPIFQDQRFLPFIKPDASNVCDHAVECSSCFATAGGSTMPFFDL